MRVTSARASRCSTVRPVQGSPLPPTSTASTIWGNTSRRIRMAWAWTVNRFGRLSGEPWTKGTAPSQTSTVFSMQPMVL